MHDILRTLQYAPTPFIATFLLIHLVPPVYANAAGSDGANQAMVCLGLIISYRNYYPVMEELSPKLHVLGSALIAHFTLPFIIIRLMPLLICVLFFRFSAGNTIRLSLSLYLYLCHSAFILVPGSSGVLGKRIALGAVRLDHLPLRPTTIPSLPETP